CWEEALKKQRQMEEEYHRFLAKLPTTLSATDRERIQALAQNVPSLWNAADTTAADRKRIVRCLVERVVVVIDQASERNDVTIVWTGGLTTQHQLARPVSRFDHLQDYQGSASATAASRSRRWRSPPCLGRALRRALSTRMRRMASAAAAKKWPRLSQASGGERRRSPSTSRK